MAYFLIKNKKQKINTKTKNKTKNKKHLANSWMFNKVINSFPQLTTDNTD